MRQSGTIHIHPEFRYWETTMIGNAGNISRTQTPGTAWVAVETLGLFVLTVAVLWLLRPTELSDNAVHYLDAARQASWENPYFYPPHLMHVSFIGILHGLLSALGPCDIICAGMAQSVLWAGIGAASVYVIARQLFGAAGGVATAIAVLLSHGFWVFGTQPEVYVPAVGAAMAASALLLTAPPAGPSPLRLVAITIFWVIAVLYHIVNVVLFVPFLAYFHLTRGRRGWWQWAATSCVAGGIVVATFLGAYAWTADSLSVGGFFTWLLEIANRPLTNWGTVANWDPADIVRGLWNQIEALVIWPQSLSGPLDYPWYQVPLAFVVGSVTGTSLLWNVVAVWKARDLLAPRVYFLTLFAVWFLIFTWWDPSVHKFYIHSAIPLIFLVAFAVRDVSRAGLLPSGIVPAAVTLAIVVTGVLNVSSVLELRRSRGPYYAEAAKLVELTPPDCRIYTVGQHLGPLKLYFDRHQDLFFTILEREFYRIATGEMERDPRRFAGESCVFVMLGWLSPQRFEVTVKRYLPTARWEDHVAYVLDARPHPDGGFSYNPFEIVADGEDARYVVIDRRRRVTAADMDVVAQQLREAVTRALARFPGAADLPLKLASNLLAVPFTGFEAYQNRERIFGYSWGDDVRSIVNRRER